MTTMGRSANGGLAIFFHSFSVASVAKKTRDSAVSASCSAIPYATSSGLVSPITDVTPNALEAEFTTNITRTRAGNYLMRAFTRTRAGHNGRREGVAVLALLMLAQHSLALGPHCSNSTTQTSAARRFSDLSTSFTAQWDTHAVGRMVVRWDN